MIRVKNGYTLAEYAPAEHRYSYQVTPQAAAHTYIKAEADEPGGNLLPVIATTGTAVVSLGGTISDYYRCSYERTITWYNEGYQQLHTLTSTIPAGDSYFVAIYDGVRVPALGTATAAMYFAIHGFGDTTCIRSRCDNGGSYAYYVDYDILRGKVVELDGVVQSSADYTYTVTGGEI